MADEDRFEVARWYTAGRRFPRVMGRLSDGTPIPGGPYTIQQLAVFVIGVISLNATRGVWGVFGSLINYAVIAGVPFLAAKALGVFAWGRNPVTLVYGFLLLMRAPREGRINGRAVGAPTLNTKGRPAAAAHAFIPAAPPPVAAPVVVEVLDPDPAPRGELTPLTGVQQLLAGRNDR